MRQIQGSPRRIPPPSRSPFPPPRSFPSSPKNSQTHTASAPEAMVRLPAAGSSGGIKLTEVYQACPTLFAYAPDIRDSREIVLGVHAAVGNPVATHHQTHAAQGQHQPQTQPSSSFFSDSHPTLIPLFPSRPSVEEAPPTRPIGLPPARSKRVRSTSARPPSNLSPKISSPPSSPVRSPRGNPSRSRSHRIPHRCQRRAILTRFPLPRPSRGLL